MTAVFQAMLYFHALQVTRMAADQGLQATQGISGSTTAGRHRVEDVLSQFGQPLFSPEVSVNRTAASASVSVTGHIAMLLPGFHIPVQATATGPVSAFTP